jgi:hypothetical protein
MKKNTHWSRALALGLLVALLVPAPLWSGCVHKTTKVETGSVSLGQQLQDLEKAHQNGTISDKEYQQLRKSLINKYK